MVEFCSLRGNLLAADKQQVEDALDLFTKLINIGEIAEKDISYLKPLIDIVGSKKMTQAVDTYAGKPQSLLVLFIYVFVPMFVSVR